MYCFTDTPLYLFSLPNLSLSSEFLIYNPEDIVMMDIGCGRGAFLAAMRARNPNLTPIGLTLFDYQNPYKLGPGYIVGNADLLFDRRGYPNYQQVPFQPLSIDIITSQKTFMHLSDPAMALIQAYHALKIGGILLIDEFTLPGLETRYGDFIHALREKGYQVSATYHRDKIISFAIVKSKPELVLPIQYLPKPARSQQAQYRYIHVESVRPITQFDDDTLKSCQIDVYSWIQPELKESMAELMSKSTVELTRLMTSEYRQNKSFKILYNFLMRQNCFDHTKTYPEEGDDCPRLAKLKIFMHSENYDIKTHLANLNKTQKTLLYYACYHEDLCDKASSDTLLQALGKKGFHYKEQLQIHQHKKEQVRNALFRRK